ncbi:MAG: chemotaxis-specific protein-glutamate methyltransferase CheB [Nitrospinae bacterium]|nr:chemotaxis-specific protein-glutamate methyltransferase CheB [Nitrospinota bacterium]
MATTVLIVDDSPLMRDMLADLISMDQGLAVVGMATNGAEAVRMAKELKPDIISMDIRMPVMEGFEAIETIMADSPCPIMVVTDFDSSKTAFSSISKGALDIYPKKNIGENDNGEYVTKLKSLSKVKVIRHLKPSLRLKALQEPREAKEQRAAEAVKAKAVGKYDVVAIASSTGGPRALNAVLSEFKGGLPAPIVVAQHMDDGFVMGFVEWLASSLTMKIRTATNGEDLLNGVVYFAPPGKNIKVAANRRVLLIDRTPKDIFHPSCDMLLSSVAEVYREKSVGVILTGMGDDGAEGIGLIQRAGGLTIAQDEKTSVVYGMPGVTAQKGYADFILPLPEIGRAVAELFPDANPTEAAKK